MRRRRKALAVVVAVLLLAVAAAAVTLSGGSGKEGAAEAAAAPSGTATVQRRTLAETLTASGTIDYAGESTAIARLSGTLTWLPAVGDVIRRGEALYELGDEPVVLMYGTVPAYRELREGVSDGADVRQLERNLAALGYEPGTVDGEFTTTTAAAVADWQDDLGLPQTGAVALGRVTFLPGPRRVTEVEAELGEAIGSGGSGGGMPTGLEGQNGEGEAVAVAYKPEAEVVEPNAPAGEAPAQPTPQAEGSPEKEAEGAPQDQTSPDEAASEATKEGVKPAGGGEDPADGTEEPAAEGGESEPSSVPVLKTSSTRRVVTVALEPDQQSLAHQGQRVEVVLPDGREAKGKIERLAAAEAEEGAPGEEAEAGVEATVVLTGRERFPALDGASVNVVFTQRVRKRVLAVPLTSLLAVGAGRYAVEVVGSRGRRRIEVTPGLAADGYVEVRGRGLREGMRVETGE